MTTSNHGLYNQPFLTTPISCSVHRVGSMGLFRTATIQIRNTLPFLRPIREMIIGFTITGYLIYKIPISGTSMSHSIGSKVAGNYAS